jgi:short subunit dehydrogenase-like uncharacterized protein
VGWLIYGANGYTGELVAREAAARGLRPVLAGRRREAVGALAAELGCEARAFPLDDPAALREGLRGARAVLHCAGPFIRTWRAMADACLETGAHYLDVTGEIPVFEALAARDGEARARGVTLLPGVGFDVVPSDCLAAHLKQRLPSATSLTLAFTISVGPSRGTATTALENLHRGGLVRRGGVLTPVPAGWRRREVDFGRGPRPVVTIPWGDVSTAFHSTGVPDIEVYMAMPGAAITALRLGRPLLPLLRSARLRGWLLRRYERGPAGPTDEQRARGWMAIWGEARDAAGAAVAARLRGPEGYTLTVHSSLAAVARVLEGKAPPGFQTPSRAFGADFVLELGRPDIVREDL